VFGAAMSREIKRALAVEPRKVEIAASDDEFVGQTRRRGDDLSGGSDDAGAADLPRRGGGGHRHP
ncbi:uncharacterized protein METZ01_LOCUS363373, partial [marine metagenome]